MASRKTRSCLLDASQRNVTEACHSEAQNDIVPFKNAEWESPCAACSPRLAKLRMSFEFFREENCWLLSQLLSGFGCKEFAESVGVSPDAAMALAGCLYRSISTDQGHNIAAAAMHSLPPEALHNHGDFHQAIVSSTLKEQISSTEKEWKILAGRYNEIVEQIQQCEKTLADVRSKNFQLESMNVNLLSMIPYEARIPQVFQGFPSVNRVMDHLSSTTPLAQSPEECQQQNRVMDQASSTKSAAAQFPTECMEGKIPRTGDGSLYTAPICPSGQKMDIACRGNNSGPFYSSPVSVLGESFDKEYFEDSLGVAYESPAYTLRKRAYSDESGKDMAKFGVARGEDEYVQSDLLHAPIPIPLAQEIHPLDEPAPIKRISAMLSESDECFVDAPAVESPSRKPLGNFQFLNSAGVAFKRQLTTMFDASLHISEKGRCNQWSPRTSCTQSSSLNS